MNIIDNIRTFFVNIVEWIKGAFSITPPEIVDPKEVQFLKQLDEKGCIYNEDIGQYERIWTTNNGKESCLEVYLKDEEGNWKFQMYSSEGDIFFERYLVITLQKGGTPKVSY